MAKRKYVYFGEVERFGYMLECIGLTEQETKEAMINEYVRAYKNKNGVDPREGDDEDKKYYNNFIEDLSISKRELGVVEWR